MGFVVPPILVVFVNRRQAVHVDYRTAEFPIKASDPLITVKYFFSKSPKSSHYISRNTKHLRIKVKPKKFPESKTSHSHFLAMGVMRDVFMKCVFAKN